MFLKNCVFVIHIHQDNSSTSDFQQTQLKKSAWKEFNLTVYKNESRNAMRQ